MVSKDAAPRRVLERLQAACDATMVATFEGAQAERFYAAYSFVHDLESWRGALADRPELALYDVGSAEYLVAMMNAAQGQYRNAFKALRLVLEIHLQGIMLSADLLALAEWLTSGRDTNWTALSGEDGVFGARFVRAFFPALDYKRAAMREAAATLYRRLSECIHGNTPVAIPLPDAIAYDEAVLELWTSEAETTRTIVLFALALRYLRGLDPAGKGRVEGPLMDRIGDIAAVRDVFGGRVE